MQARFLAKALCVSMLLTLSLSQGWAACVNPPASDEAISQFKSSPQALVAPDSDTRTIEATTLSLAGTDASLAIDLVRVAAGAIPRFRTAIAAGLAQAAIACSTVDQQAAQLIQQAVAGFQDGEFQAAFAAVAGDLSTAAADAANAFANSSVGSVVVVNTNGSPGLQVNRGGGGGLALIQLAAPGLTINSARNANSASPTTASPVSPVR